MVCCHILVISIRVLLSVAPSLPSLSSNPHFPHLLAHEERKPLFTKKDIGVYLKVFNRLRAKITYT